MDEQQQDTVIVMAFYGYRVTGSSTGRLDEMSIILFGLTAVFTSHLDAI